jgi:hypothetical protein
VIVRRRFLAIAAVLLAMYIAAASISIVPARTIEIVDTAGKPAHPAYIAHVYRGSRLNPVDSTTYDVGALVRDPRSAAIARELIAAFRSEYEAFLARHRDTRRERPKYPGWSSQEEQARWEATIDAHLRRQPTWASGPHAFASIRPITLVLSVAASRRPETAGPARCATPLRGQNLTETSTPLTRGESTGETPIDRRETALDAS